MALFRVIGSSSLAATFASEPVFFTHNSNGHPLAMSQPRPVIKRPFFEVRDLPYFFLLPVLAVVSWLLPQRLWPGAAATMVSVLFLGPKFLGRSLRDRIAATINDRLPGVEPAVIARDYVSNKLLMQLQYFRSYRPGGWTVRCELEGREHLDAALAEGRGAILWVSPGSSSDLVVKRCFHEAGIGVGHLSALTHGYSASRAGVVTINAVNRHIENRYLDERIIMDWVKSKQELRAALNNRLSKNLVLSITAVKNKGGTSLSVPVFESDVPIGAGALALGHRCGTKVLPVFTISEPSGAYRVVIEPALAIDTTASREEAVRGAIEDFSSRLDRFLSRHPIDWYGWTHVRPRKFTISRNWLWDWIHKAT